MVVNGREMVLKPDETIYLHPDDSISKLSFSSDRPFNLRLRLYSSELDVYGLEDPAKLSQILRWDDFTKPYKITMQVKEGSKVLANFMLVVRITAFDLEAQADRASDIDEAIGLYRKALSLDPGRDEIKRKLVVLLEQTGDYRTAAAVYEDMIKAEPDIEILEKLLSIYRSSMNYRKLVHTYHRLIENSFDPEARLYLYQLAQFQLDLRQNEEAIATLEILKSKLPKEQRADILKKLGYLYAQVEKTNKSIEAYEEAAQVDQNDPNIFYNLARLYQSNGDMTGYLSSLTRALKVNPMDLDARLKLAQAYMEAGELGGQVGPQIEEYESLLAKKPNDKVIRYNLGVLYFDAGKLGQAEKHMVELARLDPNDYEAKQYLFEIYQRLKREKEAYRLARDLARLVPEFEPAYDFIFDYLDRKGYYQDLVNQAKKWIESRPSSIKYREYLAYGHIKLNKLDLVVKDYESILELQPENINIMFKLVKLYEGVGQIDDAIKMCDSILKIEPNHEQAAQSHLRLSFERLKTKRDQ
ncbi:MAG: tetratricopeptide repeat protein [Deltaproteobacteria bacterium]|nr:tetratricopeptide repeat protein [Deltaproteobacteria bacterium]